MQIEELTVVQCKRMGKIVKIQFESVGDKVAFLRQKSGLRLSNDNYINRLYFRASKTKEQMVAEANLRVLVDALDLDLDINDRGFLQQAGDSGRRDGAQSRGPAPGRQLPLRPPVQRQRA